jgi:hypothetical protein
MHTVIALPKPEQLRRFVRLALCERDRLDPETAAFFEGFVKRGERICGVYFEVRGPRLMRNHAIWVGDENRILFYDSIGVRYDEISLSEAPDPSEWTRQTDDSQVEFTRKSGRAANHGTMSVNG